MRSSTWSWPPSCLTQNWYVWSQYLWNIVTYEQEFVNDATRSAGKPFYASGLAGLYGYVFADLVNHTFAV